MNTWTMLHPNMDLGMLGLLPEIISDSFPGTVAQQIEQNYPHGGGYQPFGNGKWMFDPIRHTLQYPNDPLIEPLASTKIVHEDVYFYDGAFVAIVQRDGSFEVIRLD